MLLFDFQWTHFHSACLVWFYHSFALNDMDQIEIIRGMFFRYQYIYISCNLSAVNPLYKITKFDHIIMKRFQWWTIKLNWCPNPTQLFSSYISQNAFQQILSVLAWTNGALHLNWGSRNFRVTSWKDEFPACKVGRTSPTLTSTFQDGCSRHQQWKLYDTL